MEASVDWAAFLYGDIVTGCWSLGLSEAAGDDEWALVDPYSEF